MNMILMTTVNSTEMNTPFGYVMGVVIALIILGYLLYSLVKPEKF